MEVKIDTKEKFTVVTPIVSILTDNIAAELDNICKHYLQNDVKNLVLNISNVHSMDAGVPSQLAALQQQFYEESASFVVCGLQPAVEAAFEAEEMLEYMNVTPSETEAWDIVQMEEIERELLDSDDFSFDNSK